VRLVGTAAVCAALAFGAAFLVGRAIGHNGSPNHGTYRLASATIGHQASPDPELASEFAPGFTAVKLRIDRVHHRAKAKAHQTARTQSTSAGNTSAPSNTTGTGTTPSYTAPTYTPPPTTHPSSSGQGTGTTSVDPGSSKKKKSSGTGGGVTSVG